MVDRPKMGKYVAEHYNEDELTAFFEAAQRDSMAVVIQLAAYYDREQKSGRVFGSMTLY